MSFFILVHAKSVTTLASITNSKIQNCIHYSCTEFPGWWIYLCGFSSHDVLLKIIPYPFITFIKITHKEFYYLLQDGSNSDRESNDSPKTSRKPQKRGRAKFQSVSKTSDTRYPDQLQSQPASSSYGCLSLLKKKRSGGKLGYSYVHACSFYRIPVMLCSARKHTCGESEIYIILQSRNLVLVSQIQD